MANLLYEESVGLLDQALACSNERPLVAYSGSAPGAVMEGMTVAEFVADPIGGALAAIRMLERLMDDAGPLRALNSIARPLTMPVSITMLWNSRVLIPGIDIADDSIWQVKEERLIGREAYDEIMAGGYTEFVNTQVMPRIIDLDYLAKYQAIAAEGTPTVEAAYTELGVPIITSVPSTAVPFEQLCGMRSMQEFYTDCYKMLGKLIEVSDFIYAEKYAQTEAALAASDYPLYLGSWIGGWRTASAMVNPKIWEALVWPYMKRSAEQVIAHGKIAVMHLDSDWDRDIEHFGELPEGRFILNTDCSTNLPRARQLLPKATLLGDVPPTLLAAGTPEQVSDYVLRLIDEVGPAGLIVCPGCDTPVNAKYENLVAMVKTVNEWS